MRGVENESNIALGTLLGSLFTVTTVQAQSSIPTHDQLHAGWKGPIGGPQKAGKSSNSKDDNDKEKKKKDRKKKHDDTAKNAKDKQKTFDDHVSRMKADNDARGQRPYVPGWVRYPDGRQVDETYKRLEQDRDAAARAEQTAHDLYNAVK
jgi:hypothetical protein